MVVSHHSAALGMVSGVGPSITCLYIDHIQNDSSMKTYCNECTCHSNYSIVIWWLMQRRLQYLLQDIGQDKAYHLETH
jgi:hypothetical protein